MKSGISNRKLKVVLFAWLPLAVLALGSLSCCDDECDCVVVDRIAPAPPIGVFSVTGDEIVEIYWWQNTERDLAGYNIYWNDIDETGPYDLLATTDQSFYKDRGLQNGVTYFYIVTAFDRAGNESLASEVIFDTPRPEGFNLKLYNFELRHLGGSFLLNGYDFSARRRTDYTEGSTDIYFGHEGGLYLMYGKGDENWIQDAGYIPLVDVNWAPEEGWSGTGTVELIRGHSYIVWTESNNFAKFEVIELTGEYVVIDWAYQEAKGNPELVPPKRPGSGTGAGEGH